MTPDTPPDSVADIAREAERLRGELLRDLGRATRGEYAAAVTELVMFYGQLFKKVCDACVTEEKPRRVTIKVLHECARGLAIYRIWLASATPLCTSGDVERMTEHWRKVTGMVLGEDECVEE